MIHQLCICLASQNAVKAIMKSHDNFFFRIYDFMRLFFSLLFRPKVKKNSQVVIVKNMHMEILLRLHRAFDPITHVYMSSG